MIKLEPAKLLRVFLGELDQVGGRPLFEAVVNLARKEGIVGATVLRGIESFGASGQLHTAKVLRLAEHLPLVVEIVDEETKITAFLEPLDALLRKSGTGSLVTLEAVQVVWYPRKEKGGGD